MSEVVFGIHAIHEILKIRPQDVLEVAVGVHSKNIEPILNLCRKNRVSVSRLDHSLLRSWLRRIPKESEPVHQSVFAEIKERNYPSLEEVVENLSFRAEAKQSEGEESPRRSSASTGNNGFVLILDEIVDPHNLGALIRSAACAGVDAVIIPKHGSAQVTATVMKVSAGGTEHLSICRVGNISQAIDLLKEKGYFVIGLSATAKDSLFNIDCSGSIALVIGNEERGLRKGIQTQCDTLVQIPMRGNLDSLNASVAGGIALFEVVRQRSVNP